MQQTPIAVGQNFLAGLTGGMQAGQNIRQANDQNTLRNIFATQDINDPAVQKQIMGLSPELGMQMQNQAYQREQDTYQRGRQVKADNRADEAFQMKVKEHALTLGAAEREQLTEATRKGLQQGIAAYQAGDLATLNTILESAGEAPIQSLEQFPAVASKYDGLLKTLDELKDYNAGPKAADEYGRYAQEETAAGREPLSRLDYAQAKKGKGTVVYDPTTGKPLVSIGGAATDDTDISSPSSPAAMVSSIDGVLNDPALDFATGFLEWTQNIPGTASRRFGARVNQLNGQAFLQAFESLKGAGQITEVEGQKATQAIGRLDSAQSADDYRQALNELKGILQIGMERKKTGGVITSDAPGVTEVDLNGTIYRVQKVD